MQEHRNCLRIKHLATWQQRLGIHRKWCLFGKQAAMESVTRQESVTELRVAQFIVSVFVEALHEERKLLVRHLESELCQTSFKVVASSYAQPVPIKDAEGVNQIKVCFQRKRHLCSLYAILNFQLGLENGSEVLINDVELLKIVNRSVDELLS
jgi:hypothetical protein